MNIPQTKMKQYFDDNPKKSPLKLKGKDGVEVDIPDGCAAAEMGNGRIVPIQPGYLAKQKSDGEIVIISFETIKTDNV